MALRTSDDTEFNDALRKHGILPPKPVEPDSPPLLPSSLDDPLDAERTLSDDELDDLELPNSVLESYKASRLNELRAREARQNRFGRIYPIQKADYSREVTQASTERLDGQASEAEDGSDEPDTLKFTPVVCFLYKDSVAESRMLGAHLARLSVLYPATKFVSIIGDMCIPNYPDKNIPTMIIYRGGELTRQPLVGLGPSIGLKGVQTTLEDVEKLLLQSGALDLALKVDIGRRKPDGKDDDEAKLGDFVDAHDDSDDDDAHQEGGRINSGRSRIRNCRPQGGSDDDLDL
ncbi:uncharacterized protein L969DRAFT_95709 [Mixia osmundae IAM 14324]|uniref:Phosducin thioredoxin-like domain-containing protein n=1 Tax=Mixia osmundae (strain CBS 9802 / IAM 14324 / JCM 22182 / KY 12970) TaxID=764103 RepID=G7DWN3_MIXOS|nr:uncharacterized protein L969DRAFT_95709 [Mixia osmundae IAM 14324]KEI37854.1 hypothetical protein L969DRAFT_95709 [Mixia osmundae IAM 14324]GAA94993.1 hypothetical protein E5Q_01648 [Mixia osmundae IAM 14324]